MAADGVRIVGSAAGHGPGVLLVYGAMMEQAGWSRLTEHLQGAHTVYAYDRRGRGESTDRAGSDTQDEVDDLTAFMGALSRPLDLFGHSSAHCWCCTP